MFALGFIAGSFVTFVVLAVYGYKNSEQQVGTTRRDELERYYWMGYKQGVEDERAHSPRIDDLPVSRN